MKDGASLVERGKRGREGSPAEEEGAGDLGKVSVMEQSERPRPHRPRGGFELHPEILRKEKDSLQPTVTGSLEIPRLCPPF